MAGSGEPFWVVCLAVGDLVLGWCDVSSSSSAAATEDIAARIEAS